MKKIFMTWILICFVALLPAGMAAAAEEPVGGVEEDMNADWNRSEDADWADEAEDGMGTGDVTYDEEDSIEDFSYNGNIDVITGEPVYEEDSYEYEDQVDLGDGVIYDRNSERYRYPLGESSLYCSVADGMIVTDTVFLTLEGEANIALYLDGNPFDVFPESVSEPGSYAILTWTDNSEMQVMSFQIAAKITSVLSQYVMPSGFSVRQVLIDGTEMPSSPGKADMTREGYYDITYRCVATGVDYLLQVMVDHTPPEVTFEGVDENGRARGPVTVQGLTDEDYVYVTFNGKEGKLNLKSQVTETGQYRIVVTDEAGNMVEQEFRILLYLNIKSLLFFGIIILIIVGVAVALYITRKRLRVR